MIRGMYSAISGLKTNQTMLDVTANDLANVNTVGYKGSRATFKDSLQQQLRGGAASAPNFGGSNAAQVGLGVTLGSIDNQMQGGAIQTTGNTLDVAIQGEGMFRVGLGTPTAGNPTAGTPGTGTLNYMRAGNFQRNDQGYLVTTDGYYVLGRTGTGAGAQDCYINIPPGASDVTIAPDGAVSFVPPAGYTQPGALPPISNGRAIGGYLSLAKFANDAGLERVTGNRWRPNGASGGEQIGVPGVNGYGATNAGALEMSNVDLATEFTDMIVAQRGFQANSRVMSASDEMLQDLVNMKR